MEASVAQRIDGLIVDGKALLAELQRLVASRRPSKTGISVLTKFVVPSGYKRLSGHFGILCLDSSFVAQNHQLGEQEVGWGKRVIDFLGTVRTLSSGGDAPAPLDSFKSSSVRLDTNYG